MNPTIQSPIRIGGIRRLRPRVRLVNVAELRAALPGEDRPTELLRSLPLLAACEFAGAVGRVVGIWWPLIGIAAGIGLVLYFVGAIVFHLRVGDVKGIGPAAFMLVTSVSICRPMSQEISGLRRLGSSSS